MRNFIRCTCAPTSPETAEKALLFLRVAIGILSVIHGYPKMMGGMQKWEQLGMAMGALGIHMWPAFWGFAAACAEFFGGIMLIVGLGTRIAAFFESCTMVVAFMMHYQKGDSFTVYSFALSLLAVFITFVIVGGGKYSLDNRLHEKHEQD